ncbi:Arm DNA-binding domain-containing protein [Aliiroseovarius crassostreae]|uniref:Arm DNA-binding domain-containing protein n=1 Tax=Aliiroseovarius crassostreae TaxID=154981 RepID=UPI00223B3E5E|nr:Arm DNA-binding domain-containing protein [Aliiroseovarius crassostreae]
MQNKLTAVQVKNAGDGKLFDGGGLSLVRKNGSGKWVYRYSHLGKRREMGLGTQAELSLAQARKTRDKWAAVLSDGKDPISVRNAEKDAQRDERDKTDPTFKELAHMVFEARKATLRGDGKRGRWFSPIELYMIPPSARSGFPKSTRSMCGTL